MLVTWPPLVPRVINFQRFLAKDIFLFSTFDNVVKLNAVAMEHLHQSSPSISTAPKMSQEIHEELGAWKAEAVPS
jgi:hypothetical protein